ncbi:MAG: GNAT family N-acetyltransferase [Anaerolineales bacterium]
MPLSFRRATLADRPAMLAICATVWEGDDYLPSVFDEWVTVTLPPGQVTAVELDGNVVALARLARLAPGEYWLEGIRVHADYRRRGIAAALHHYHLDLWHQSGEPGTLRLVTGNPAIVSLCEQTHFLKLFEFTFAEAPARAAPHSFTRVTPASAERAFKLAANVSWYAEGHGLCDLGWKWRTLTPGYLAERITAGEVFHWRNWEAVLMTVGATLEAAQDDTMWIQFPGVQPAQRLPFLAEVRALAQAFGQRRVRWSSPLQPVVLAELPRAGYQRLWDDVEYCFEARQ